MKNKCKVYNKRKIVYFSYRDWQVYVEIKDRNNIIYEGTLTRKQISPKEYLSQKENKNV